MHLKSALAALRGSPPRIAVPCGTGATPAIRKLCLALAVGVMAPALLPVPAAAQQVASGTVSVRVVRSDGPSAPDSATSTERQSEADVQADGNLAPALHIEAPLPGGEEVPATSPGSTGNRTVEKTRRTEDGDRPVEDSEAFETHTLEAIECRRILAERETDTTRN